MLVEPDGLQLSVITKSDILKSLANQVLRRKGTTEVEFVGPIVVLLVKDKPKGAPVSDLVHMGCAVLIKHIVLTLRSNFDSRGSKVPSGSPEPGYFFNE